LEENECIGKGEALIEVDGVLERPGTGVRGDEAASQDGCRCEEAPHPVLPGVQSTRTPVAKAPPSLSGTLFRLALATAKILLAAPGQAQVMARATSTLGRRALVARWVPIHQASIPPTG